jgi:hypothetical protein
METLNLHDIEGNLLEIQNFKDGKNKITICQQLFWASWV